MDAAAFLAELEANTHAARWRRMVDLGRAAAGDAATRALLDALSASDDPYARTLVVASLYGSRDGALALRLIEDPSRRVRRLAASAVPLVCDDAQATEALRRVDTARARTKLAEALRARRRLGPIDAFFESARAALSEDKSLVDMLPFASGAVVESAFATLESAGGPQGWERLAKMHPARFGAYATAALGGDAGARMQNDPRLRWRLTAVAKVFARRDPSAALALLRVLLASDEEPGSALVRALLPFVLGKHPRETFDALRARHERGAPARPPGAMGLLRLDRVAHRLGAARLRYVVEHAWSTLSDGARAKHWYLLLSADDRAAVLDAWLANGRGGWGGFLLRHVASDGPRAAERQKAYERWSTQARTGDGTIAVRVLDALPADLRHIEARRHLALPVLSTQPAVRVTYASLLPFEEAKTALASFLGHPEGEERARAMRALLGSVLHEPTSIGPALEAVRARKFEQDPVRLAMIETLASLPVRRFATEHLEDVGAIVRDALDAADLSHATAAAAERLVVRLFRIDAAWGAAFLTTILEKRGSISAFPGLADALVPDDVDRLAPALAGLAATWGTQERSGALLWLAASFGLRLAQIPALLDALERMASEQPFVGVAAPALALLRKHAPARFAALVPRLLAADPSYVILESVATYLSVFRQDLLAPFVSDAPMTGRFATGRTSWAIAFARGHGRWTSRLHALHAAAWIRVLNDDKRDVPTLIAAIHSLVELSFAPRDALLPFASDPRQPVRETAIRALPWLDGGQGVPVLLACLDDARARWAIYALRKAFSEMRRERVVAYLRAAPTSKVTVAKEVVRLLGELGGPEAYDELIARDRSDDMHRDVRIALLRAVWDHLERPETWPIFERAAAHPDWVVASKLADVPLGRLSLAAQERVVELLVRVLERKEPEARLDLLKRCAHLPVTDAKRTLIHALIAHLGAPRPDEAVLAARALLARMNEREVEPVIARLRELSGRRQLMTELLPAFAPHPYSPKHVREVAESLVTMLARDPLATVPYVTFAGQVLASRELVAVFVDLATRDFLHSDAMAAACGAIARCVDPASIERALSAHENPRLRRLAVEALKHAAAPSNGWSRERREKLDAYRRDRAPLVAGAAAYVFPPD